MAARDVLHGRACRRAARSDRRAPAPRRCDRGGGSRRPRRRPRRARARRRRRRPRLQRLPRDDDRLSRRRVDGAAARAVEDARAAAAVVPHGRHLGARRVHRRHDGCAARVTARRIVVVGGGPAGVFAAIAAKRQDPGASVSLITREACEPYEKPPLSKTVLLGRASPEDAPIAGPAGIAGHGVALELGAACAAIDRGARAIVLADGRRMPYDALVLATGSAPREMPQLPIGTPRVCYLRTDADARALRAALGDARDLLVIGGGLIGLEVAASAATLGVKTTVLEVAPRILARVCDERTSACVHAAHVRHGAGRSRRRRHGVEAGRRARPWRRSRRRRRDRGGRPVPHVGSGDLRRGRLRALSGPRRPRPPRELDPRAGSRRVRWPQRRRRQR
ncbi:MAG: hypothetical protein DMF93_09130 [Acidobacteria bacterium]|nr:MAG: hypothetical protein DMF93_09130 [Acidobacteriota bacterium]